jgi:ATP-binding cassette subfamily G (WHITE) protein 2
VLTCTPQQALPGGACPVATGEQTIQQLGLSYLSIGGCAAVLVGYILFCRLIAYLGVRFIKW